jgi:DNA-binding XRE family transcriptional regulator
MEATLKSDAASSTDDGTTARLRVDVYDRLIAARNITTLVAAAEMHGLNRTQLFDYRAGRKSPNLSTAMRMAADLGAKIEDLFELRPAGGPE